MLKLGSRGHIAPTISGGDFLPPVDDIYDLGSATQSWQDVYADGAVYTDLISEFTADTGVTIDGLLVKDGGVTLAGPVAGGDQAFTNVGDMTFAAGSILASGSTNGNTLILRANDTAFITFTTGATDACTIASPTMSGTWLASGTVTLPAHQLSGNITGTSANFQFNRDIHTDVVILNGGTDDLFSAYWTMYGKNHTSTPGYAELRVPNAAKTGRIQFLQVVGATNTPILNIGEAGASAVGQIGLVGNTSGKVTVTVSAVAGTWTMTLPAAVAAAAGYQLTDSNGAGLCTWTAAGSLRELKNVIGPHSPKDALDRILGTKVYDFHYKEDKGTGDRDTLYTGVMADEAPWAMHFQGGIVNPVNTLGYMVLGFQAQEERILRLEQELAELKGAV